MTAKWIGSWPKIGIRPAIDGRRKRRARIAGRPDHGAWPRASPSFLSDTPAPSRRLAGRVRHRRHLHRRRGRSRRLRREVRPRGRRRLADRHALLVLRLRNDGHGPAHARRPSGASTAPSGPARSIWRRCWPATTRRACPPSASTAATCRTPAIRTFPPTCSEKLLRFARAGLAVATMRGKSYLSLGGVSMGIAGSIVNQTFFEDYLGMRVECVDMTRVRPPHRGEDLRRGRIRARLRLGAGELPGRQGLQPAKPRR